MVKKGVGKFFEANVEAVVCPVNLIGKMTSKTTSEFRLRFPEASNIYMEYCRDKKMEIGHALVVPSNKGIPKYTIFFPISFQDEAYPPPASIRYLVMGVISLIQLIEAFQIKSIAMPLVGVENGLDPKEVRSYIKDVFDRYEVDIYLFEESDGT